MGDASSPWTSFRQTSLFFSEIALNSLRLGAVGFSPIIALFGERHQEGLPESVVFRRRVPRDANFDFVLRNVQSKCSVQAVPPWENDSIVGICLMPHLRMVNSMHTGGDQNLVQQAFQADRQAQVAMVKEGLGLEDQFIREEGGQGSADQAHLRDSKAG